MAYDPYRFGLTARQKSGGLGPELGFPTERARRDYAFGLSGDEYARDIARAQARRRLSDIMADLPADIEAASSEQGALGAERSSQYQKALAAPATRAYRTAADILGALGDTTSGTYRSGYERGISFGDTVLGNQLDVLRRRYEEEADLFR